MADYNGDSVVPGAHYLTIDELRATARELTDVGVFPVAKLETVRDAAEEDFEELCHRAFVPRIATCWRRGGDDILLLPFRDLRTVESVTLGGTELDLSGVEVDPTIGGLRMPGGWPDGLLNITYTHGYDSPPAGVKRAVLLLAKEYALPSAIPSRATVLTNDVGSYRISVADKNTGRTGIPDVDAAIARYGLSMPVVG